MTHIKLPLKQKDDRRMILYLISPELFKKCPKNAKKNQIPIVWSHPMLKTDSVLAFHPSSWLFCGLHSKHV